MKSIIRQQQTFCAAVVTLAAQFGPWKKLLRSEARLSP